MKTFIFLILFPVFAKAFTLNNNFEATFDYDVVKVSVDRNTVCENAQISAQELSSLIKPAVNKFWNTVATSSIRLKSAGFSGPTDNINDGLLCPPTDTKCIDSAGSDLIPPVKHIVIACNDKLENFGKSNVLAVTVPNNFNGKKIKGAIILINNMDGSAFANLSHSDRVSVIAHEIGHALGLGHSEDKAAMMYYRTVKLRKKLGQDDIDGISYLYPVHVDGCGAMGGLFGTIKKNDDNNDQNFPFWPMVISFMAMVGIFELLRALKKFRLPIIRF